MGKSDEDILNRLNLKIVKRRTSSDKGSEIEYSAQFVEDGCTSTLIFANGTYTSDFNYLLERVYDYMERHKKDNKLKDISYKMVYIPEEKTIIIKGSLSEEEARRVSSSLDALLK